MSSNQSIRDFFKPKHTNTPATTSSQSSPAVVKPAFQFDEVPEKLASSRQKAIPSSLISNADNHESLTSSSLSPLSSSAASEPFHTPPERRDSQMFGPSETLQSVEQAPAQTSRGIALETPSTQGECRTPSTHIVLSRTRVIMNSDDEGEESDDDFQNLSTLFGTKSSAPRANSAKAPLTPQRPRTRQNFDFLSSPLTVQPKIKYDLKTLVRDREDEDALEVSSKRIKAMLASQSMYKDTTAPSAKGAMPGIPSREALLDSVVSGAVEGEAFQLKRALNRTEAAIPEKRWSFFNVQDRSLNRHENPFPTASIPVAWKKELSDPDSRYQTFISGFAEDMVGFGKVLPNDLLLWMLDELCWEESDPLRTSYLNVLCASTEQLKKLLNPVAVQKLFHNLGGSEAATQISTAIEPTARPPYLYSYREYANLLTVLRLLTEVGDIIQPEPRNHAVSMLLRMSIDNMILGNVDLLQAVQGAITQLCQSVHDAEWEQTCESICKSLFSVLDLASLRFQVLESISSTTQRSHELRRRLALCFFFDDVSYACEQAQQMLELDKFITRLEDPAFKVTPDTDFRELSGLISLLDLAVDDGASTDPEISGLKSHENYDQKVDELSETIKAIMRFIGNPGASFFSKLEAKRNLELVEKRISASIRSKPKLKHNWFDGSKGRKEEDLYAEKHGMASFVLKMKHIRNDDDQQI